MGIFITVGAQQFAAGTTALTGRDLSSNVEHHGRNIEAARRASCPWGRWKSNGHFWTCPAGIAPA